MTELCAEARLPFDDYTTAVRNLSKIEGFSADLVDEVGRLPGFRNALLHEYVDLDYDLVLRAMGHLDPVEEFARIVSGRFEGERGE